MVKNNLVLVHMCVYVKREGSLAEFLYRVKNPINFEKHNFTTLLKYNILIITRRHIVVVCGVCRTMRILYVYRLSGVLAHIIIGHRSFIVVQQTIKFVVVSVSTKGLKLYYYHRNILLLLLLLLLFYTQFERLVFRTARSITCTTTTWVC